MTRTVRGIGGNFAKNWVPIIARKSTLPYTQNPGQAGVLRRIERRCGQSARTHVAVRQIKATQPFTSNFLPPSINLTDLALKLRSSDGL